MLIALECPDVKNTVCLQSQYHTSVDHLNRACRCIRACPLSNLLDAQISIHRPSWVLEVTPSQFRNIIFTAQCTLVQSAVLRSHVVSLSVCPSVCNVGGLWSHIGWNSSKFFVWGVRSLQPQHDGSAPRGTPLNLGPKWSPHPVDLSVGDIRSQIAAEWLQRAQRSQWRA